MNLEDNLIWESYILSENNITLNQIYGDLYDIPENEALYHEIDPETDGDIPLELKTLNPQQLMKLTAYADNTTVFDAYNNFADRDQKKIVNSYRKSREYKTEPIVINMNTALDGYHRIIAAILNKDSLLAVDISDLHQFN